MMYGGTISSDSQDASSDFMSSNGHSLKAPAVSNYNSLKAKKETLGTNDAYLQTYTAGEDASRLAMMAKELGLKKKRAARNPVRRIVLQRAMHIAMLQDQSLGESKKSLPLGQMIAGVAGNILEW